jgi:Na+/H+-dicarboxylate symporter
LSSPSPGPERHPALIALATLGAFFLGYASESFAPAISRGVQSAVDVLFSVYDVLGPAILFIALASSLGGMFTREGGVARSARLFGWLLTRKALALAWGIVFTSVVLDLPLAAPARAGAGGGSAEAVARTLGAGLLNPFTWAAVAAVATALVARDVRVRGRGLEDLEGFVEKVGGGLQFLAPLFLFFFGAYVRGVPDRLPPLEGAVAPVEVLGGAIRVSPFEPGGALRCYLVVSGLVFAGTSLWHLFLVVWARLAVPGFRIARYFTGYFIRVYPFLFATGSESLSMPLNVAMTRRFYGRTWDEPSRFVVTAGSTLSVNGTVICAVVFAGFVGRLVGVPVSFVDLVLAAPSIFVVSLAVPGIPGELALFVDPIAAALGVPAGPFLASFRTLFLGFQVGLPDSSRTGINSTDNCVNALLMSRSNDGSADAVPGA